MNAVKRQQLDEGEDQSQKLTALKDNMQWRRYVLAVFLAILAFGVRYQLGSVLGDELPFMLFIAAALGAVRPCSLKRSCKRYSGRSLPAIYQEHESRTCGQTLLFSASR